MIDNYFMTEGMAPDEAQLQTALGSGFDLYRSVMEAVQDFEADWNYYGKKYGWKLKIHDGEKALVELSAGDRGLRLAIAVREEEMEGLRDNPEAAKALLRLLGPAGKKSGWALVAQVSDQGSCETALAIVKALASLRMEE